MSEWLLIAILLVYIALRVAYFARAHEDAMLGLLLLVALLARIAVGIVNHTLGPLPGAQIDAVMFEETARTMASIPTGAVNFVLEAGKLGYSSLLAVLYMIGGYHFLIATVLNAVFAIEFLILVYVIAESCGGRSAGRLATALTAFYPTAVIYSAVPLREAPLYFGFALFVKGLLDYYDGRAILPNWRTVAGLALCVWLHDGFFLAVFLVPITLWFRFSHLSVALRGFLLTVGLGAIVALFGIGLTVIDFAKMPDDPMLLTDPAYLARMRELKSAYGEGYGAFEASWSGIVRSVPLLFFAFLAAPFPVWWSGLSELPKVVEGVASLTLFCIAATGVLRAQADRRSKLLFAMFLYIVFVFAMGTGNTGIAARHRAKFVWMPIVLTSVMVSSRAGEPARDEAAAGGGAAQPVGARPTS